MREGVNSLEVNGIVNLISTIGFPIAICLILMWYIFKTQEAHKVEVSNLTEVYESQVQTLVEKHQAECTQLSTALNNNTIVMKQILEHIRKE